MFIGVDVGATNTKFGVFDEAYVLAKEDLIRTDQDYDSAIEKISKILTDIEHSLKIRSVGIGLPGVINSNAGEIVLSGNLPDWSGKKITEDIANTTQCKVKVENDAVCAALAEATVGFGVDKKKFIYITWGTGIGGTVIERIGSKIHVLPIEPGAQILEWNGITSQDGLKGSLGGYVEGREITNVYGKSPEQISDDDPIWDQISQKMAQGLINTLVHHPSELIVLGGGIINKQPHLLDKIRHYIDERLITFNTPELVIAKHGEKSGIYGAAMLPSLELI